MRFSCFLGPTGRGAADDLPLIDFCMELALACDEAGFAIVTVGEQHFANYEPYGNPFTMIAALAGQMKNSYLGTTVVQFNLYHPFKFAQFANIADLMTRGKCLLGISSGASIPPLMMAFGVPEHDAKKVFEEKLEVTLRAWAKRPEEPPTPYKTALEAGMMPTRIMPVSYRNPHPLLAIGTNTDATIQSAAQRGWPVYLGRYPMEEGARKMRLYREALQAAGHSPEKIAECTAFSNVTKSILVAETDDEAWRLADKHMRSYLNFLLSMGRRHGAKDGGPPEDTRSFRELWEDRSGPLPNIDRPPIIPKSWVQCETIIGGVDSVVRQLKEYEAAGVEHMNFRFVYGDFAPDEVWRNFNLFTKEVMPKLNPQTLPPPRPEQIRPEHLSSARVALPRLSKAFRNRA